MSICLTDFLAASYPLRFIHNAMRTNMYPSL